MDLQIVVEGEVQLHRRLIIIANGVTDFQEPLRSIGTELHKSFQENFDQRGALFGGWPERKPVIRKGERIDTWPLLEKTGEMRNSFDEKITSTSIVLFNSASYFPFHQSKESRQVLPRRIMMKIDQERKTFIVKAFQQYLVTLMRK